MTREEMARVLSDVIEDRYLGAELTDLEADKARFALAALLRPQPDPITGLVPCGCGGKAVDNEGIDYGYGYKCQKCGIATMAGSNRDCAKEDWNTAMGWKGGAE